LNYETIILCLVFIAIGSELKLDSRRDDNSNSRLKAHGRSLGVERLRCANNEVCQRLDKRKGSLCYSGVERWSGGWGGFVVIIFFVMSDFSRASETREFTLECFEEKPTPV